MLLLVIITVCIGLSQAQFDPYSQGPYTVIREDISHNETEDLSQNLNIWFPTTPGTYPFFLLLDSFGALTPGDAYADVMQHIASFGFIAVNAWALRSPVLHADKVPLVQESIEWCKNNLEELMQQTSENVFVDYNTSFAMGHSAGSHVLCDLLEESCGDFKAIVWSSPVDGNDPTGAVPIYCTRPSRTTLKFITNVIILPVGLDHTPPEGSNLACAPDDISNRRFWDALDDSTPRWMINATAFGHADYLDPAYWEQNKLRGTCAYNEDATTEDLAEYRDFVAGTVVSFLKAVMEDDCSPYLPFLEDSSVMPVDVAIEVERTGCPSPFCTHI